MTEQASPTPWPFAPGPDGEGPTSPSLSACYLLALLEVLEARVRALVDHRRANDSNPSDPFRGLYISEERLAELMSDSVGLRLFDWGDAQRLAEIEAEARAIESDGGRIALRQVARRAGLDGFDVWLLLVALAPDLDPRFERVYGYLNDDVTRWRPSVALALELAGGSVWSPEARRRLGSHGRLVREGLVVLEGPGRPQLSRVLEVPERVCAHLLGAGRIDPGLEGLLRPSGPPGAVPPMPALVNALNHGVRFVYLQAAPAASAAAMAEAALVEVGIEPLVVDLNLWHGRDDPLDAFSKLKLEALLAGGGLVVGPLDALSQQQVQAAMASLTGGTAVSILSWGRRAFDPNWCHEVPLALECPSSGPEGRLRVWEQALEGMGPPTEVLKEVADQFLLPAERVVAAVQSARLEALAKAETVGVDHLRSGARSQNGAGLERLARRLHPRVSWSDLVLPASTMSALRDLASRARRRTVVIDEWGMRPGGGRGRGVSVLFAGESGTGKTMSAEVVAGELGLDLYTVNLATVVDKYVGETEKNLERIFVEADGVNAVLLFDEADAIFGKRSEVKDANDRYANIEVAYLLQRMETFDGIAILSTNLKANIDEAFARRLDLVVDFPPPDVPLRRALWERCLAGGVPLAGDLDLDFCARAFELSGGGIRNAAIAAAYLAAESGRPVGMAELVRAIAQEYRKLGRLVVEGEFGPYFRLATAHLA